MLRFIVNRLLLALPTLFAVLTLVFVLVRVVPGDPAQLILGDQASPAALAALRERLGLDKPLWRSTSTSCSQIAARRLGRSMVTEPAGHRPRSPRVLPYTIELTLASLVIGIVDRRAARRRRGAASQPLRRLAGAHRLAAGLSFPAFVSGILLLLAFAIELRWFPVIATRDRHRPDRSACARSRCRRSTSA